MPTTQQADKTKYRWIHMDPVSGHAAAPTDGTAGNGGTDPDIVLSPFTISKLPTTGFVIMLKTNSPLNPGATPGAGGFTVTVWERDPSRLAWAAFASQNIPADQLWVTFDVDAGELYFQITNVSVDGILDVGIAEQ